MNITIGKSLKSPIILRKNENEFWNDGDTYNHVSAYMYKLFGGTKFTITAASPRQTVMKYDPEYGIVEFEYCMFGVVDGDGDTHQFYVCAFSEYEFEKYRKFFTYIPPVPRMSYPSMAEAAEETKENDDIDISDLETDIDKVKEEIRKTNMADELSKTEIEVSLDDLNKGLTIDSSSDSIETKPRKKRGRPRKN